MVASVLLGILSGNSTRRAVSRCTIIAGWRNNAKSAQERDSLHIVFVVGSHIGSKEIEHDVLYVPVVEKASVQQISSTYGSTAVVEKVFMFLMHALSRPRISDFVAIADDDSFLNLPLLHKVSTRLNYWSGATHRRHIYAGASKWYNLWPERLDSVGWGSGPQGASYAGRRHGNCTIDGSRPAWRNNQWWGSCIGPFNFMAGPLVLLSSEAVRQLARGEAMRTALMRAKSEGKAWRHNVKHDVILGHWLTAVRNLTYVNFGGGMMRDDHTSRTSNTYRQTDVSDLLSGHQLAHSCWADVDRAIRSDSDRLSYNVSMEHCASDASTGISNWTLRPWVAWSCTMQVQKRPPCMSSCQTKYDGTVRDDVVGQACKT